MSDHPTSFHHEDWERIVLKEQQLREADDKEEAANAENYECVYETAFTKMVRDVVESENARRCDITSVHPPGATG